MRTTSWWEQYQTDADRFREHLAERLKKFGLELHPDKTRRIEFGRFAEQGRKNRGERKPETFDFLGYVLSAFVLRHTKIDELTPKKVRRS